MIVFAISLSHPSVGYPNSACPLYHHSINSMNPSCGSLAVPCGCRAPSSRRSMEVIICLNRMFPNQSIFTSILTWLYIRLSGTRAWVSVQEPDYDLVPPHPLTRLIFLETCVIHACSRRVRGKGQDRGRFLRNESSRNEQLIESGPKLDWYYYCEGVKENDLQRDFIYLFIFKDYSRKMFSFIVFNYGNKNG